MREPGVLLAYMRANNPAATAHFAATVAAPVSLDRIAKIATADESVALSQAIGSSFVLVWGVRDSEANRQKFQDTVAGDFLLIVEGQYIRLVSRIGHVLKSDAISRELWPNEDPNLESWPLLFFLVDATHCNVPFREFSRLFGYKESYKLQGFTRVAREKLHAVGSKPHVLISRLLDTAS